MPAIARPERVATLTSIMSTTGNRDVGAATPEALAILMARPPSDRGSVAPPDPRRTVAPPSRPAPAGPRLRHPGRPPSLHGSVAPAGPRLDRGSVAPAGTRRATPFTPGTVSRRAECLRSTYVLPES